MGDRDVDRGNLGAGVGGDKRHEAEMVDVVVCHHYELDVLERMAEGRDAALQRVERGARVRARIDQCQRLVLDQVDVHAADRERRRYREPVNAGCRGRGEGVRMHGGPR